MKNLPTIYGKTIYLGPMPNTESFYNHYKEWLCSDRAQIGIDHKIYTIEEIKEFQNSWFYDPKNYTFCIFELKTHEPIGDVCLRYGYEAYPNNGPETAILIGKYFGKGKGYEAMLLILSFGFEQLEYDCINLSVYQDNMPAIKLYEKLGFSITNKKKDATNGRDEFTMILYKNQWNHPPR